MPQEISGDPADGASGRYAIVVSRYNETVTKRLLGGAVDTLRAQGVPDGQIDVAWVPGAFEIPVVAEYFARGGGHAAVVCLGAVIRGETTHDQHINRAVSLGLAEMSRTYQLPVLFGLLTCDTLEQAIHRSGGNVGNKGAECAAAALEMVGLLGKLNRLSSGS
ncbi:MAG: 6,7-dimethyl-8-ribityllumazine synthase [Pirellulales bacterium]|nr:6,7-dimethyl-8-ribityllumazine synthase [Pirellulales bacterium]